TPVLAIADDGTRFQVAIATGALPATSRAATLSIDAVAPTLVNASGSESFDQVLVTFSEAVDATLGTNTANYSISGLTISRATLSANGTKVTLNTAKQTSNTS